MNKTFFAVLTVILFVACGNGDKKDYDQMAKDLCSCMRPLADMNQKIKELVDEGKTDEVTKLFADVERIAAEGETCATSLEGKYGVVEGESEEKAAIALKKHCPDIATLLEQNENSEQ